MNMQLKTCLLAYVAMVWIITVAVADIYLSNPRGSNNRADEDSRERRNAKRLFDSQNNNRGGYNIGNLYYYVGSKLKIEWTNQHSCNDPNNNCEIIVQYMCHDRLRDGIESRTIPDEKEDCYNYDCNNDLRYGMHETYEQYDNCFSRERNHGLFTADQELKGHTAIYTRQNPDGTRRGYECPEERDYYPYWLPTDWKDIVVMTNKDIADCDRYRMESQNSASRWHCVPPSAYNSCSDRRHYPIPITEEGCEAFRWPKNDPTGERAVWTEVEAHAGAPEVDCIQSPWSRDNHHGNGRDSVHPNNYEWTIPNLPHKHCALRIRYNISTNDFGSDTFADKNGDDVTGVDIGSLVGLSQGAATDRGYIYQNNPVVDLFGSESKLKLRLAINTAQYGRTFQDRSHKFEIRSRPAEIPDSAVIHNVNVRGKRGNIVQNYPAVEYDFVPNVLDVAAGDYVHFQWTGSNTNPNNNDGQGRHGTDRSNVLVMHQPNYDETSPAGQTFLTPLYGHLGNSYPWVPMAGLDTNGAPNPPFLGFSNADKVRLALLRDGHYGGEISELDDAGTYFDLGAKPVSVTGIFHYFCTRNNNFSNRSQKGKIVVVNGMPQSDALGEILDDEPEAQSQSTHREMKHEVFEEWTVEKAEEYLRQHGGVMKEGEQYASNYYVHLPVGDLLRRDEVARLEIPIHRARSSGDVSLYHSYDGKEWDRVDDAILSEHSISLQTERDGFYVVKENADHTVMIATIVMSVALVVIVSTMAVYGRLRLRKSKYYWSRANVSEEDDMKPVL